MPGKTRQNVKNQNVYQTKCHQECRIEGLSDNISTARKIKYPVPPSWYVSSRVRVCQNGGDHRMWFFPCNQMPNLNFPLSKIHHAHILSISMLYCNNWYYCISLFLRSWFVRFFHIFLCYFSSWVQISSMKTVTERSTFTRAWVQFEFIFLHIYTHIPHTQVTQVQT